jgi:N-acetylneuraminate synthase
MLKKEYSLIPIPDTVDKKISEFLEKTGGLITDKTQAISQAWQIYEKIFLEEKNPLPIQIGNKLIGHSHPIFVVGEIGLNHVGDINICKRIIDMAVRSGCDAIKFQKRVPEKCVPENHKNVVRETPWGLMTYLDYRKKIEFGEPEYKEIDEYCKKKGIIWFASAWDVESVEFLENFNVPCYKIPSPSLTDKELLLKIKSTGKPRILSTGMSKLEQIKDAVEFLGEQNLIILHCNSSYPASEKELNLNVIKELRKNFNCPIGYSGHEVGVFPSIVAMATGACIVERHITIDRSLYGGDQAASLEERGISIICREAKLIREYLGDGIKKVYESEEKIMKKLRKIL